MSGFDEFATKKLDAFEANVKSHQDIAKMLEGSKHEKMLEYNQ